MNNFEQTCTIIRENLSPEYRFLLNLLYRSELPINLNDEFNWERFISLARKHKVVPQVAFEVFSPAIREKIPKQYFEQLQSHTERNTQKSLILLGELLKIHEVFKKNAINILPLKGPALAIELYGGVNQRTMVDLDILVREKDIQTAAELLLGMGYQSTHSILPTFISFFSGRDYHSNFHHRNGVIVEIHWRFDENKNALPLDILNVFEGTKELTCSGRIIPTLSFENEYLYLSYHGGKHCWAELKWITDLYKINRDKEIDWDVIWELAVKTGNQNSVALSSWCLCVLSGCKPTWQIEEHIRNDENFSKLLPYVLHTLFEDESKVRDLFDIKKIATRAGEVDYLKILFPSRSFQQEQSLLQWKPTFHDYRFLSLPRSCVYLYYLIRPIRVIMGKFSHVASNMI